MVYKTYTVFGWKFENSRMENGRRELHHIGGVIELKEDMERSSRYEKGKMIRMMTFVSIVIS